jgi:hypothetical protein
MHVGTSAEMIHGYTMKVTSPGRKILELWHEAETTD